MKSTPVDDEKSRFDRQQTVYKFAVLVAVILVSLFVSLFLRLGGRDKPQPTDELSKLRVKTE